MIQFAYEDILKRLRDNLTKRLDNSGILFYSANQRILEAIAEELSEQMRYNEYLTNEAKWSTAQNISSLIAQSDFFGYVPHRKIGSVGELVVSSSPTFNGSWAYRIDIPKFSQFFNGEYYFAAYESASLFSTNTSVRVPIVQGLVKKEEFPTTMYEDIELTNFVISIKNDSIEDKVLEVRVNNVPWRIISHFGESTGKDDLIYKVKNDLDYSGITITFGDGLTSKKIKSGDLIEVTYIETAGELGEVLRLDNITQVVSAFRDANGTPKVLYCTNDDIVSGGREAESIESIRLKAPITFKTGNSLVTRQDYIAAIIKTGIPDKVSVWGETEQNIDNGDHIGNFIQLNENVIKVSGLTISDITKETAPLTLPQQALIQEQLVSKKSITDIIQFVEPKITYFDVDTIAYYDKSVYTKEFVENNVTSALLEQYAISNTERDFKESLYFSQYYAFINSFNSVAYHETEITMFQISQFSNVSGASYLFTIDLNHKDIREKSCKIYIRNISDSIAETHPYSYKNTETEGWYHIATDDGVGGFTSENVPNHPEVPDFGSTFDVHSVVQDDYFNYDSGSFVGISLSIGNGIVENWQTNLQLKFEFKVGDTEINIIPNHRYQIFGIHEARVEAKGM